MADAKLTIELKSTPGQAMQDRPRPQAPPPGPVTSFAMPGQQPVGPVSPGMDVRQWEQMLIRAERRRLAQQKDVGRTLDAPGMLPDAPPPDIFLKRWERTLQLAESQAPPAGPAGQGPQTLDLSQGPAYVNAALVARQAGEDMLRPGPGTPDPNLLAEEHLQYVLDQIAFIDEAMEKIQESLDDRKITLQDAQAMNERLLIEREWQVGRLHEHQEAVEKQNMPRQVADFIRMAKQAGREYVPDNVTATGTFEPVEEVDSPWVRSIESVIGRVTGGLAELPQDLADGLRPRLESLQDALAALGNTIEDTDLNRDAIEKMAERMAGHYTYARTQAVGRAEDELSGPAEVTLPWLDRLEGIVQKSAEGLKELPQDMAEGLGEKLEELRQAMADLGGTIEDTDVNRMAIDKKMDEFLGHYGDAKNKAVDQAKGDIFGEDGAKGPGFFSMLMKALMPKTMGGIIGLSKQWEGGVGQGAPHMGNALMLGGPQGVALTLVLEGVQRLGGALTFAGKQMSDFGMSAAQIDADAVVRQFGHLTAEFARGIPVVGGFVGSLITGSVGLLDGLDRRAAQLAQYSPEIATARAQVDIRRIERDMARAQREGPRMADYVLQRDETRARVEAKLDKLMEKLLPMAERVLEWVDSAVGYADTLGQIASGVTYVATAGLVDLSATGRETRDAVRQIRGTAEQIERNGRPQVPNAGNLFTELFPNMPDHPENIPLPGGQNVPPGGLPGPGLGGVP